MEFVVDIARFLLFLEGLVYCFGLGWVGWLFVRVLAFGFIATPLKTRTEPEYHPFGKEQHLPNHVSLPRCISERFDSYLSCLCCAYLLVYLG